MSHTQGILQSAGNIFSLDLGNVFTGVKFFNISTKKKNTSPRGSVALSLSGYKLITEHLKRKKKEDGLLGRTCWPAAHPHVLSWHQPWWGYASLWVAGPRRASLERVGR